VTDPFAEFDTPEPAATSAADGAEELPEAEPTLEPAHERRRRWPGYWSFGVAAAMVIVTVVAITLASMGEAVVALTLTISGLGLSGIAIVLGLVSIFGRYARPWGIAGLAIAVVINPLALLYGLSALGMF
jgi:hypothetical protein